MTKEKKKGIATVFTRQLGSGLSGRPVGNFENQFLFENRKKEKERKCNLAGYDVYTLQLQIYLFINLKILNNSTTNTRLIWYSSIQTLPLAHLNSVSIVTLQSSLLLDLSNTHFSLSLSLSLSLSYIYRVWPANLFLRRRLRVSICVPFFQLYKQTPSSSAPFSSILRFTPSILCNSDFAEEDLIFAHSSIQNQFEVTFAYFTSQFFLFSLCDTENGGPRESKRFFAAEEVWHHKANLRCRSHRDWSYTQYRIGKGKIFIWFGLNSDYTEFAYVLNLCCS